MTIRIVPAGRQLTDTPTVVYTAPAGVVSSTVAAGTVENHSVIGVRLWIRITGRGLLVVNGKDIPVVGSPLQLPVIALLPGESLEAWAETAGVLDIALTIGEQR